MQVYDGGRDKKELEQELVEFAVAVNREIGIRLGSFPTYNETERRQRTEGTVPVHRLDSVREMRKW